MTSSEYLPELAASLDRLVPADDGLRGDWDDVVGRVRTSSRARVRLLRSRPLRLVLVVGLLFLVLAGVATATYFAVRASHMAPAAVTAIDDTGKLRTVWRCPASANCGAFATDAAFAPDGRHLAFVTDSLNSLSLYQGLHVIDVATGADHQLPAAPPEAATPAAQLRALRQHDRAAAGLLGCARPHELAWSPDGSRLAYACPVVRAGIPIGRIYMIRPDGSGRRLVRTGTASAYWPTWSPDGRRIAFSTETAPVVHTDRTTSGRPRRWIWSAIYVVDLDGSHTRLVMRAGAAPDWSPDGKTIAYWATACTRGLNVNGRTRLVTPSGRDVTPHSLPRRCGGIGPVHPIAAWSPDGTRLAVRAWNGLHVMGADGSHLKAIPGTDGFGSSRPIWQPHQ